MDILCEQGTRAAIANPFTATSHQGDFAGLVGYIVETELVLFTCCVVAEATEVFLEGRLDVLHGRCHGEGISNILSYKKK